MICLHFFKQIFLLQSNKKIEMQRGRKNVQLIVNKTTWKNRTFAFNKKNKWRYFLGNRLDRKLHESILKLKLLL